MNIVHLYCNYRIPDPLRDQAFFYQMPYLSSESLWFHFSRKILVVHKRECRSDEFFAFGEGTLSISKILGSEGVKGHWISKPGVLERPYNWDAFVNSLVYAKSRSGYPE